jgi:hypothetical protein
MAGGYHILCNAQVEYQYYITILGQLMSVSLEIAGIPNARRTANNNMENVE